MISNDGSFGVCRLTNENWLGMESSACRMRGSFGSPTRRLISTSYLLYIASLCVAFVALLPTSSGEEPSVSSPTIRRDVSSDDLVADILAETALVRRPRSPFRPPMVASRKRSLKNAPEPGQSRQLLISQRPMRLMSPFSRSSRNRSKALNSSEVAENADLARKSRPALNLPSKSAAVRPPSVVHRTKATKKAQHGKTPKFFKPLHFKPQNDQTPSTSDDKKINRLNVKSKQYEEKNPKEPKNPSFENPATIKRTYSNSSIPEPIKTQNHNTSEVKSILTDLPFTEIVHSFSLEPKNRYIDLYGAYGEGNLLKSNQNNLYSNNQVHFKDSHKSKLANDDIKITVMRKHPKLKFNDNDFSRNGFYYDANLPATNNPMILPYQPARTKPRVTSGMVAATISSLTVQPKRPPPFVHNRSQFMNPEESSVDKLVNSDEVKQSNLRLVFPVRGILMFCGILGVFAISTILILIIYGAVKCNQTPNRSNYQLTESQDMSSIASSSMKSIEEQII